MQIKATEHAAERSCRVARNYAVQGGYNQFD